LPWAEYVIEGVLIMEGKLTPEEMWSRAVEFHGHQCPGLAIGIKACLAAQEKMGIVFSQDEEIICVTENDACCVDAIQAIAGCTFGKGNLVYRPVGKIAFSFFNRHNGDSLRLILKPAILSQEMERKQRQDFILKMPTEDLFDYGKPSFTIPEKARLFATIICEKCGEGAAENRTRLQDGKKVCPDCFTEYSRGF
jgi:formylmethanofuran dehydrogenase subunit E